MTIARGVTSHTGFVFTDFNLEYQIEMHVAMMIRQWPQIDPVLERKETRRLLLDGQCWLWPEPKQLELFK